LPEGWPRFLARLARKLENWLISQADLFIITDLLRMPQHEGATPKDLLEIANVPDIPEPLPPVSPPGSQFTVGYLGSLIEGRNLQTLVEACGALAGKGVHLVIGSFGPLESQIETLCQKYDNVTFKHWLPYEMMLLEEKAFDLFIHITDPASESQKWVSPNKLFEAMAFGKPILVGKHTLAAQRVEVFQNGIAVDYGSHTALTEAILHLKNNPNLAMDMGENGQREFQRAWRMDMMEKRLLEHYERLLNRL